MEDGAEVDVCFQSDEDILEFIRAVDEQESLTNETEEAVIDVSRNVFCPLLYGTGRRD